MSLGSSYLLGEWIFAYGGKWGIGELGPFAAIITALVILSQGEFLGTQLQTQTLLDITRQWNSETVVAQRKAWAKATSDEDATEDVLLFLEDAASFWRMGVLQDEPLWHHSLGWYTTKYYLFGRKVILRLRTRHSDETLYENLELLALFYIRRESKRRKKSAMAVILESFRERTAFIEQESR